MILEKDKFVFEFDSGVDGPSVVVLGGVHGNELCGVDAIYDFLNRGVELKCGRLVLIIANPLAIERNVRFVEENLNRCFLFDKEVIGSYEERLACEIKEYLDCADFVLDLHSSGNVNSQPFVICEENCLEFVRCLGISKICLGFSKVQQGGTDFFMNCSGRVGVCVECGSLFDESSSFVAVRCLYLFLNGLGLIELENFNLNSDFDFDWNSFEVFEMFLNYQSCRDFVLSRGFEDFDFLEGGELIGFDGGCEVRAEENGIILFAKDKCRGDFVEDVFVFGRKLSSCELNLKNGK